MLKINQNKKPKIDQLHIPVMLNEVLHYLQPQPGEAYLDATAGYGGHAKAVLERSRAGEAILIDRDSEAISELKKRFKEANVKIVHQDFLSAAHRLVEQGKQFDMILADLGVSSPHFEKASRGFSLKQSGPLDMRMDDQQELTAARVLNTWKEARLEQILKDYGQEPKARTIARRIVAARPLKTTDQLAAIVASVWGRGSKIHPATRTFQALRIAVNDELLQLEQTLPLWLKLLAPGGRLVVISFHSLEDRLVKNFLAEHGTDTYDAQLSILTKKPLQASPSEIVLNPRSRSARLRAAVKIKTNRKE